MEAGPCDSVDADCDSVGRSLAPPAPSKQSRGGGGVLDCGHVCPACMWLRVT